MTDGWMSLSSVSQFGEFFAPTRPGLGKLVDSWARIGPTQMTRKSQA